MKYLSMILNEILYNNYTNSMNINEYYYKIYYNLFEISF